MNKNNEMMNRMVNWTDEDKELHKKLKQDTIKQRRKFIIFYMFVLLVVMPILSYLTYICFFSMLNIWQ